MTESNSAIHAWTPPGFTMMAKARGPICNLNCEHCYYLSKAELYPGSDFRMSDELLETYVRQYIQSQRVPEINFVWQGGEPILMGLEFYERAVALQKKYAPPGMKVLNSFQTNGTLITEEWAAFFKKNDFLIGISIDGPAEIHDRYRKDIGGNPSFERVRAGLDSLKQYDVEFNVLTCVSVNNADRGLEVYRYLRDELGVQFMQFIPIVERENESGFQEGGRLTRRSITTQQYARFLIEIFHEWVQHDVGRVFVQIFDATLASWMGQRPGLCIFEETCGLGLVLEHNGDVYSCDHFVEPAHRLGNLNETALTDLVYSQQQHEFGMAKLSTLPDYCLECNWRFACNGGCPKNRIRKTLDGEPGLNYLCAAYQTFFEYVERPMNAMAQLLRMQRAPAEIMKMIAEPENDLLDPIPDDLVGSKKTRRRRH
ncbi:MAG: anaerobic sulfatase maturase [Anaerolineaceae bacterium]|nr:anaerobic sulfatase maturase [Anaerolineaceae bacterium]